MGQVGEGERRRVDTWKNCTHALCWYGKGPSRASGSWLGSMWFLRAFSEVSTSTCREKESQREQRILPRDVGGPA